MWIEILFTPSDILILKQDIVSCHTHLKGVIVCWSLIRKLGRQWHKWCDFDGHSFAFIAVELSAVTEDNRVLKQRIQTLESELKK